jgi:hypothetical protein
MMNWIIANIKWIMLLSGALTCTMFYAAIAPQAALQSLFGASFFGTSLESGMLAEIIVRNWGALITIMGAILIYGAFNASSRTLVLTISGISKLIFMGLVLVYGQQYLNKASIAIAIDAVSVLLFIGYLIGDRQRVMT